MIRFALLSVMYNLACSTPSANVGATPLSSQKVTKEYLLQMIEAGNITNEKIYEALALAEQKLSFNDRDYVKAAAVEKWVNLERFGKAEKVADTMFFRREKALTLSAIAVKMAPACGQNDCVRVFQKALATAPSDALREQINRDMVSVNLRFVRREIPLETLRTVVLTGVESLPRPEEFVVEDNREDS